MHTVSDAQYLLMLLSPTDLVTMAVLVIIVWVVGDAEDRLTMREAAALIMSVGLSMLLVSAAVQGLGAPKEAKLVAYFAIWWCALVFSAAVRPIPAAIAVCGLVGIHLLGLYIQNRVIPQAVEKAEQSYSVPASKR